MAPARSPPTFQATVITKSNLSAPQCEARSSFGWLDLDAVRPISAYALGETQSRRTSHTIASERSERRPSCDRFVRKTDDIDRHLLR